MDYGSILVPAKRFVLKLDANVFRLVMDGMLMAAVSMLWNTFLTA